MSSLYAAIAHTKFLPELRKELSSSYREHENLLICQNHPSDAPLFSQVDSRSAEIHRIESIGDAAKLLKTKGKLWAAYAPEHYRRSQLILDKLPKLKSKPLDFLGTVPTHDCGFFSLLNPNEILIAPQTKSPFPLGEILFNEDKENPPSRAYLKLWELFTVHKIIPHAGQRVLDFGACPGGWTWVLQQIGCQVLSVDKAPLDPRILALPRVEFKKCDAFKLKPSDFGPIDWFFSDIICYPPDLFELIKSWRASGFCRNFVCTIKFQGETDFESVRRFKTELGAKVIHLYNNKHEVTAIIQS